MRSRIDSSDTRWFALVAVGFLFLSCFARLPDDFSEMSLEEQIGAVKTLRKDGAYAQGTRSRIVREISLHGMAAARAMEPFLAGEYEGIDPDLAVDIVDAVQVRGCSLAGTPIEGLLESVIARTPNSDYSFRAHASVVLDRVRRDFHNPVYFGSAEPVVQCE